MTASMYYTLRRTHNSSIILQNYVLNGFGRTLLHVTLVNPTWRPLPSFREGLCWEILSGHQPLADWSKHVWFIWYDPVTSFWCDAISMTFFDTICRKVIKIHRDSRWNINFKHCWRHLQVIMPRPLLHFFKQHVFQTCICLALFWEFNILGVTQGQTNYRLGFLFSRNGLRIDSERIPICWSLIIFTSSPIHINSGSNAWCSYRNVGKKHQFIRKGPR